MLRLNSALKATFSFLAIIIFPLSIQARHWPDESLFTTIALQGDPYATAITIYVKNDLPLTSDLRSFAKKHWGGLMPIFPFSADVTDKAGKTTMYYVDDYRIRQFSKQKGQTDFGLEVSINNGPRDTFRIEIARTNGVSSVTLSRNIYNGPIPVQGTADPIVFFDTSSLYPDGYQLESGTVETPKGVVKKGEPYIDIAIDPEKSHQLAPYKIEKPEVILAQLEYLRRDLYKDIQTYLLKHAPQHKLRTLTRAIKPMVHVLLPRFGDSHPTYIQASVEWLLCDRPNGLTIPDNLVNRFRYLNLSGDPVPIEYCRGMLRKIGAP